MHYKVAITKKRLNFEKCHSEVTKLCHQMTQKYTIFTVQNYFGAYFLRKNFIDLN